MVAAVIFALGSTGNEGYCWLWPSIDTRYAPDYAERKFQRIESGMTQEQVVGLIGQPLRKQSYLGRDPVRLARREEEWSYTGDGAAWVGDWAWLSRKVVFNDGRVVQTVSRINYD